MEEEGGQLWPTFPSCHYLCVFQNSHCHVVITHMSAQHDKMHVLCAAHLTNALHHSNSLSHVVMHCHKNYMHDTMHVNAKKNAQQWEPSLWCSPQCWEAQRWDAVLLTATWQEMYFSHVPACNYNHLKWSHDCWFEKKHNGEILCV